MAIRLLVSPGPREQNSAPLRNKIIAALRSAIATGVLEPGARLVEQDLCEQLNVSRTSLREALRELQADGLLEQVGGRGLSVASVSRKEAENAYRMRAALEALVVEQFIERARDVDVRNITKDVESLNAAYHKGDVARMLVAKNRFFENLCTGADNALAYNMVNRLVLRTASLRNLGLTGQARREQSLKEVNIIMVAIRQRDASQGRRAAATHVKNAMMSVLTALDREIGSSLRTSIKPRRRLKALAQTRQ